MDSIKPTRRAQSIYTGYEKQKLDALGLPPVLSRGYWNFI